MEKWTERNREEDATEGSEQFDEADPADDTQATLEKMGDTLAQDNPQLLDEMAAAWKGDLETDKASWLAGDPEDTAQAAAAIHETFQTATQGLPEAERRAAAWDLAETLVSPAVSDVREAAAADFDAAAASSKTIHLPESFNNATRAIMDVVTEGWAERGERHRAEIATALAEGNADDMSRALSRASQWGHIKTRATETGLNPASITLGNDLSNDQLASVWSAHAERSQMLLDDLRGRLGPAGAAETGGSVIDAIRGDPAAEEAFWEYVRDMPEEDRHALDLAMQREHADARQAAGLERDPAAQNLMRDMIYQRNHVAETDQTSAGDTEEKSLQYDADGLKQLDITDDTGAGNDVIIAAYQNSTVEPGTSGDRVVRAIGRTAWENSWYPQIVGDPDEPRAVDREIEMLQNGTTAPGDLRAMSFAATLAEPYSNYRSEFATAIYHQTEAHRTAVARFDAEFDQALQSYQERRAAGEVSEPEISDELREQLTASFAAGDENRQERQEREDAMTAKAVSFIEHYPDDWRERSRQLEDAAGQVTEIGMHVAYLGIKRGDAQMVADGRSLMAEAARDLANPTDETSKLWQQANATTALGQAPEAEGKAIHAHVEETLSRWLDQYRNDRDVRRFVAENAVTDTLASSDDNPGVFENLTGNPRAGLYGTRNDVIFRMRHGGPAEDAVAAITTGDPDNAGQAVRRISAVRSEMLDFAAQYGEPDQRYQELVDHNTTLLERVYASHGERDLTVAEMAQEIQKMLGVAEHQPPEDDELQRELLRMTDQQARYMAQHIDGLRNSDAPNNSGPVDQERGRQYIHVLANTAAVLDATSRETAAVR